MIIISAGIPKSGSTLLMFYAQQLIKCEHGANGQLSFEQWVKYGPVGGVEAYPWENWTDFSDELETIEHKDGPFVLKTHKPFDQLEHLISQTNYKLIFSYRDPRDIILSMIDHGVRSVQNNEKTFVDCVSIGGTMPLVKDYCDKAVDFIKSKLVCSFKYEDLVANPLYQLIRLGTYFGITDPYSNGLKAIEVEEATRTKGINQFNKGLVSRFRNEMTMDEIQFCNESLEKQIIALGYDL